LAQGTRCVLRRCCPPQTPNSMYTDEEELDEEELEFSYQEACNEAVELAQELRAAKIEAQQLRLRLKAEGGKPVGIANATAQNVPVALPGVEVAVQEQRMQGICDMFQWIADNVDLSHTEVLDVNCEVPVGGRTVLLQKIAQWSLPSVASKRLRVSVPIEHQEEIAGLLRTAKSTGRVGPPELRRKLAATWELVPGELSTPTQTCAEPAVLLAHHMSSRGILVATWPTREALKAFALLYVPEGSVPSVGERVEALYEGTWYLGTVQALDDSGKAVVKCDVDEEGTFTVIPLSQVRRLSAESQSPDDDGASETPAAATAAPRCLL